MPPRFESLGGPLPALPKLTCALVGHCDGCIGLRSASTTFRQPFAICCPFQACASAIPPAASRRRAGGSAAGSRASASLSCSRLGSLSAGAMSPQRLPRLVVRDLEKPIRHRMRPTYSAHGASLGSVSLLKPQNHPPYREVVPPSDLRQLVRRSMVVVAPSLIDGYHP